MPSFPPAGIPMPRFTLTARMSVAMTVSPYTFAQRVYDFGADVWMAEGTVARMLPYQHAQLEGWLLGLRGPLTSFLLGNLDHDGPGSMTNGDPILQSVIGAREITVKHTLFAAPPRPALALGAYLTIDDRLYRVTRADPTNGSGGQALALWPTLRTTPAIGSTVNVSAPHGTWRLTSDPLSWSHDWSGGRDMSLSLIEAL